MFQRGKIHVLAALPRSIRRLAGAAFAALALLAGPAAANAMADGGALFTQTNDPAGNAVQRFERARDGSLTPAGTFLDRRPRPRQSRRRAGSR